MSKYFGTDGFRGRFGQDITVEHALKIGQFLGFYYGLKDVEGIVVGMDPRESSPFLKTAITMGINSFGVDVYDLETITTPGIAYLSKIYEMPGVVISASHNPYWDNGIKLFNEKGEKMDEGVIHALEVFMDSSDLPSSLKSKGNIIPFHQGKDAYIDFLVSKANNFNGLKIAIDTANGAASEIAKEVFKKLNITVDFINDNPNGKNINIECGSTSMDSLSNKIKNGSYDIGFSYDGDGDRCLICDEAGNILSGDHILYFISKYMHDNNNLKNDTVVATLMSNIGLNKALEKEDINVARVAVGDKNVYAFMKLNHCNFGGEQSGHFIFLDDFSTGDGILTSIKILNILSKKKDKISNLVKDITIYPQVLKNVSVKNKEQVLLDDSIKKIIHIQEERIKGKGRIFVRPSGTESKIRVMAEADAIDLAKEVVDIISKEIESSNFKMQ